VLSKISTRFPLSFSVPLSFCCSPCKCGRGPFEVTSTGAIAATTVGLRHSAIEQFHERY
jgi:hypothetical protein